MPKFTNRYGLPAPLFHALTWDTYTKGDADISVTEMLKSPRQRLLAKRHDDEIEIDASANLWTLAGRAVHQVLQHASKAVAKKEGVFNGLAEERLTVTVEGPIKPWKLSGEFDLMHMENDTLILSDYKFAGVYSFLLERKNGFVKPEWEKQLNIYRWMIKKVLDFDVDKLQIGGLIRDWKKSDYEKKPDEYPPAPIMLPEAAKWPFEEVEALVKERIRIHQLAEIKKDNEITPCTPDERWERGEAWAVMKKGRKTAVKLFDDEIEAHAFNAACNKGEKDHYVEHRPGRSMRCDADYCHGAPWCDFFTNGAQPEPKREYANVRE